MAVATLAAKDFRLLLRDRRAAVILFGMPVLFVFILGMLLDSQFGLKSDNRLCIAYVDEDDGPSVGDEPPPNDKGHVPVNWVEVVLQDLGQSPELRLQKIESRAMAERAVGRGDHAAVLVFGPEFSSRVGRCSFLANSFLKRRGINPFFREGIDLKALDVAVLRDPAQGAASAIIEQVAQVTLLRVVMPWMIGRAFDEVGKRMGPLAVALLKQMFAKYDLTAKNWASLTKSAPATTEKRASQSVYEEPSGGLLERGSLKYQTLVPAFAVTFAFFLVLSAGWLFVAERRQGTLVRLRVAPLARWQILAGKLIPCYIVSLAQAILLLGTGRLAFGMHWGPQPLWLIPVVACTSLAATGLALLIAGIARSESQVAVYGTLLVLVLAGISGCLMPRALMPEVMRTWSKITPHAWALEAYNQLLLYPNPDIGIVASACGMLLLFGFSFLLLGWWRLRLE